MSRKTTHVVPFPTGWAVKPEGSSKPTSTHRTQQNAIDRATSEARRQSGPASVVVHRPDATFREERSFNGDPYPPKG